MQKVESIVSFAHSFVSLPTFTQSTQFLLNHSKIASVCSNLAHKNSILQKYISVQVQALVVTKCNQSTSHFLDSKPTNGIAV